jgi:hypothetical protein
MDVHTDQTRLGRRVGTVLGEHTPREGHAGAGRQCRTEKISAFHDVESW